MFFSVEVAVNVAEIGRRGYNNLMFQPKFSITNPILKYIGQIEGAKEVVDYAVIMLELSPLTHREIFGLVAKIKIR